jgi:hypothetical protein
MLDHIRKRKKQTDTSLIALCHEHTVLERRRCLAVFIRRAWAISFAAGREA